MQRDCLVGLKPGIRGGRASGEGNGSLFRSCLKLCASSHQFEDCKIVGGSNDECKLEGRKWEGGGETKRPCERHPPSQAPLVAPSTSGFFCTCLEVSSPTRTLPWQKTQQQPQV